MINIANGGVTEAGPTFDASAGDDVFDNAKIRQAIALIIDKAYITDSILKNGSQAAYSFVPSNSKIPQFVLAVLNQLAPLLPLPTGLTLVPFKVDVSISALITQARLPSPRALYAAINPYSFNSSPCNEVPLALS